MGRHIWLTAVAVAIFSVLPRILYRNVPFERDEGAYAYMADVINSGGMPYLNAFDHKPPLIYYFYQISFKLFGHNLAAPRLLAAIFVAVAGFLVLLLVYRLTRSLTVSVFSCLLLGAVSALPVYTGFCANTEVFTLPFLVGGVLLLAEDKPSLQQFFWSGLLFGVGIMVKQPVAVVALAVFAYHAASLPRAPWPTFINACCFGFGLVLPMAAAGLFFASRGAFPAFWECFYVYNASYANDTAFAQSVAQLSMFLGPILRNDSLTWLAGSLGLLVWLGGRWGQQKTGYIGLFLAGSVLATSIGGNFYPHYFIFLLPVLVTGAGLGAAALFESSHQYFARLGMLAVLFVPLAMNIRFMSMPFSDLLFISHGNQPFVKAKMMGDFLKQRGAAAARTAFIIGSEPEILYYSGLKAASRYFYLYPLVGDSPQNETALHQVVTDLQKDMPDIMVFVNYPVSLGVRSASDKKRLWPLNRAFSDYKLTAMCPREGDGVIAGKGALEKELAASAGDGTIMLFERRPGKTSLEAMTLGSLLRGQEL